MTLYEHIFMVRQDASSTQVEALTEQFKSIISENGGSVEKTEYWGIKSLAYKIKKNRKAHFSLLNLKAPSEAVGEMERQMRINDDVIRFMTIRVDQLDEGQSVMMRPSRGRDDRGPRPDRPPRPAAGSETEATDKTDDNEEGAE